MEEIRKHDFSGLAALWQEGLLTDLSIRLCDGKEIAAHRAVVACASDVIKAKFTGPCRDAVERCWQPDAGSAEAWQWIIGWIYGSGDPVPWELFVEVLIVADRFQVRGLAQSLLEMPLAGKADVLLPQLLSASACPAVLGEIAAVVVPAASSLPDMQHAPLENLALWLKHLPQPFVSSVPCDKALKELQRIEEERLGLLGLLLRARRQEAAFPRCLLEALRWERFPTEALEAGLAGDFSGLEGAFGGRMPAPGIDVSKVLVARCKAFEEAAGPETGGGLFARMQRRKQRLAVECSSTEGRTCRTNVLSPDRSNLTTRDEEQPWIELKSEDMLVKAKAVGLRHGQPNSHYRCKSFVVEAARGEGAWEQLLAFGDLPLPEENGIFVLEQAGRQGHYDRFRLRMTGRNSSNNWLLSVSWFDILGSMWSKKEADLRQALESQVAQSPEADGHDAKRQRTE